MSADHLPSHENDPGAPLPRGATVGRYVVLRLVGRGGMGYVYAAYDPELDRKIALKLLRVRSARQDTGLDEGRARLLREAQSIAKLSHGNVVQIYDVGTFEDTVFLAMEFIEGQTLSYWCQASPRGWRDVLQVFVAAGRGLAAAHDGGMVHRDFKPDNVMVGGDGKVTVMDFGLARQIADTADTANTAALRQAAPASLSVSEGGDDDGAKMLAGNLTQTGTMLGTPAYMAPEQFTYKATDARTDQFSYCIALYEALYGRRPFAGRSLPALMKSVMAGTVDAAPAGKVVPLWIRRILLRGLSAAADNRYRSMNQLLAALENDPSVTRRRWAIRAGAVSMAIALSWAGIQTIRDRPVLCQGGGAKLAGIWEPGGLVSKRKDAIRAAFGASGKSYATAAFAEVSGMLDRYVAGWIAVYRDACQATAVRGEQSADVLDLRMSCLNGRLDSVRALTDVFLHADGKVVEKAASATAALAPLERCSDVAILRSVVEAPDDPVTRAAAQQLRRGLAEVKALGDSGRTAQALLRAQPLLAQARALGYLPVTAEALLRLGWVSMGRPSEAAALMEEAAWTAAASGDHELLAEAAVAEVFAIGFLEGEPDQARPWIRLADATLRRIGGHDVLRSWLLNNEGAVFFAQGQYEESLATLRRSAELKEKMLGAQNTDAASSLANMGDPLSRLGRYEEALEVNGRALKIFERNGYDHADAPMYICARAEYLNALGRFTEAEGFARQALRMWEQALDRDNAYHAYGLTALGITCLGLNRAREAVPLLERAHDLRTRLDPDSSRLGETAFALARALWQSHGDRARARNLATEAERAYAKTPDVGPQKMVRRWIAEHGHN